MPLFTDQLNRKLEIKCPPQRIISLVPSQTELLYDLGLRDEVVGITKFCIHPDEWFRTKTRVGGTKKYDLEKINNLKPDLIIGNKEENEKDQIELLMKDQNVWMSDIYTLKDALWMIVALGAIVGKNEEATNLKLEIESRFHRFQNDIKASQILRQAQNGSTHLLTASSLRTAYFIWRKPFMAAGHDTFINEMMKLCGFENVFTEKESRYPEVTAEEIIAARPEVILLSSEPYPFKEKHIEEFRSMLPNAKILVVDGEIFSWYGSRLLKAPQYFTDLIASVSEKP
ncbi:MAG: cobalamin-binding protein [Bacteroidetes bacterium]|jgi:ABC-type Fe3+-hydroxamate transport system substrate-binding protein|nr:cobalamin-binding protein [Bacteroidota bacterium]